MKQRRLLLTLILAAMLTIGMVSAVVTASAAETLQAENVTLSSNQFTYNGAVQKPTVVVKNAAGKTLTQGTSYSLSYSSSSSKYPGSYSVTVTAKGNYSGTVKKTYTIVNQPLDASRVTLSAESFPYNGAVQQPEVTVMNTQGGTLTLNGSYTVAYSSGCKLPGTYTVTLTGKGYYTGTVTKSFTIDKQVLDESCVTLSADSFVFNAAVQTPTVTVKNAAGTKISENVSYTATIPADSKLPGAYTVTVKGKGNYAGTVTKTFTIESQPLDESRVTISADTFAYNAEVQKPTVTVRNAAGSVVTVDRSYTVSYSGECKMPGTYTVTVTGKGNYAGTVTKTFTIERQQIDASRVTLSKSSYVFNAAVHKPTVTVKNAAGTKITLNSSYTVEYSGECKLPGTYTVTVTGKGNYAGTVTKTFTINKQPLDASRVTLSKSSYVFNAAVQKPTVTVKNAAGTKISLNTSYTLSYSGECKLPNTYTITVTGKGNYSGTVTKTFTITKQPLDASRVTLSADSFEFNGEVQKPTVTVKNAAGTKISLNTSYTLAYSGDCIQPGTYSVTVEAKGNYSGSVTKEFTITAPPELTADNVTITGTCFQYDGTVKTPEITAVFGNTTLVENVDYTVSYSGDCIENGTYTVTVAGINDYVGEVTASFTISESGHTPEAIPAVEATCTADGSTEGSICAVCGTVLIAPETIPAIGHDIVEKEAADPTCTEDGYIAHFACTRCGAVFTDADGENETTAQAVAIPATGHDYLWKVLPATCTEKAQVQKLCDNCNVIFEITYDDTSVPTGHSGSVHVPATCTEGGYNEINCTNVFEVLNYYDEDLTQEAFVMELVCGYMEKTYIETEPDLGGHVLSENAADWTEVTPATCLAGGVESQACSRCGENVTRETSPLGHKKSTRATTKYGTCTATGTKTWKCTRCNEIAEQIILPITHSFSNSNCTIAATCTEKGYTITECSNHCLVEKTDLQIGDVIKLNATSVTLGSVTITTGDNIPALYGFINAIGEDSYTVDFAPIGHPGVTGTFTADDFTAPAIKLEIEAAKGHAGDYTKIQERTCTQDGIWAFTSNCTRCGAAISGQELTVEHTGHTPKANTFATCTEGVPCATCGETAIAPLGHDFVIPGCVLTEGSASGFYCQRCGYTPVSKSDKITTFKDVMNLIKSPEYATKRVSAFSKSKMNTSYTKFDFGIYTSVVKDYYESSVPAVTIDYDPLETASIFELFPLRNRSYAVKSSFTEDDVKSFKVEQMSGLNTNSFLTGYNETAEGSTSTPPDLSSFQNKTIGEKVLKITVELKNETYQKNGSNIPTGSTINSYGQKVYLEDTHTSKIFDYDIRKIVDNAGFDSSTWKITEGGSDEGYEMSMTLNYIKADTTITYYFTADDYQPIAAIYNIKEAMDQDLTMNIMSINGVIKPIITTERYNVYLFSDFFNS